MPSMEKGTDIPTEHNKPSFFKVMIGSYATELRIPVLFVKKFHHFLPQKVVLSVSPSKLWIVDVVRENKKEWYFKTGWDKFVKENALEVGEFIVFQFAGNSTFNVKIFGISGCDKEVQMGSVPYSDVKAATEKQKERISTADSGRENPKERKSIQENQQKQKTEDVIQLKREKAGSNDNIKLGDGLKFRFSGRDDKEAEEENDDDVIDIESDSEWDVGYHRRTIKKKRRTSSDAVEKEGSLDTKNPSFQIVMKQASVERGLLNLPTVFLKKHLNIMKERIELELQTSRGTWAVKMIRHPKDVWTYGRFSAGWLDFARDNDLRAGDTCSFELIRKYSPLFIVHIHRKQ